MAAKTKVPVYDYELTTHYGVSQGPADALFGIYVDGKLAWPPEQTDGDDSVAKCPEDIDYLGLNRGLPVEQCINPNHGEILTTERTIFIDETELFGGDHRNGGVRGVMHWLPGRVSQLLPSWIAARLGFSDPSQAPAYRGITSLWFTGGHKPEPVRNAAGLVIKAAVTGAKIIAKKASGFRWGTNSKYDLVPAGARVFVRPSVPALSAWLDSVYQEPDFPDAESSVIVIKTPLSAPRKKPNSGGEMYDQGGGFPTINVAAQAHAFIASGAYDVNAGQASMDHESFITCARILSKEKLGVSFIVTGEESVKDIVGEMLNHVGGAVYVSPKTGLWTMRLFRPDSAFDDLWGDVSRPELTGFVLDPSNARLDGDFERQTWADIVNTLDVSFTEDETQEKKTFTLVNSSAIAASGGETVRDDLDLQMFRCEEAAKTAGLRALGVSSRPLMSASWVVNLQGADLEPLDVITVNWPSEGVTGSRWRVLTAEYGDSDDGSIRIEAIEDVFSADPLQLAHNIQPGLWTPEPTKPEITNEYFTPLSYQMARLEGHEPEELDELVEQDQVISAHILASRQPMIGANVFTKTVSGSYPDDPDFVPATPCAVLGVPLVIEDDSTLNFYAMDFGPQENDVDPGDLMVIVRPRNALGEHYKAPPYGSYRIAIYPQLNWGSVGEYYLATYTIGVVGDDMGRNDLGNAVLALDETLPASAHGWKIGHQYPEEVCMVTSVNRETGQISLRRGCYDTHPAPAPANSIVYHVKTAPTTAAPELSGTVYNDAYQPLSVSGISTEYHYGSGHSRVPRASLPPRNANVLVSAGGASAGFGGRLELDEPQDVTVSWATRNRKLEDRQPLRYSAPRVTPEAGQRTVIRVFRRVQRDQPYLVPVISFYDLPGDSYTLPAYVFNDSLIDPEWNKGKRWDGTQNHLEVDLVPTDIPGGAFVITVGSHKYGDAEQGTASGIWFSLQESVVLVDIGTTPGGWGLNWGMDYGGTA